jgi:putative Holliday junction resolvase
MNMASKLILGVDFGLRYLGFALAYSPSLIVPIKGVDTKREGDHVSVTLKTIMEYPISGVVVGCPGLKDASSHELKPFIEAYVSILTKESGLSVVLWDEELTSYEASSLMKEISRGRSAKRRGADKIKEHALSAALILKSYLE